MDVIALGKAMQEIEKGRDRRAYADAWLVSDTKNYPCCLLGGICRRAINISTQLIVPSTLFWGVAP